MTVEVTAPAAARVHWWLAVEPLAGDDVVWALTKVSDDTPPTGPADAGVLTGLGPVRALAESVRPLRDDLWGGPLTDPGREGELAARLGVALLPEALRVGLLAAAPD